MSVIPITCDNCGAKYKLPPTFKGTQAKCQKCGSVIDVAKQRESAGSDASPAAAAKPAAARPAAAAKPAVDRSKSRTGGRKAAAAAASPKAAASSKADKPARAGSSRSRRGAKDDDGEDTPRRGREKKKDNTPMIIGGVGLLAVVVVVVVMMMGGDDKKDSNETADDNKQANAADANANKGATKPDEGATPDEGQKPDAKPDEGATPDASSKPEEGVKPAETAKPAPTPVDNGDPNVKKERWQKQKNPPQTMSEVRTALEMYGAVQWPESIDATKKAEIMELAGKLDVDGGIGSIRAKAKLVNQGYYGLFGILETLSKLDYRQPNDGAFGFELNKAIEDITGGLNAGYAAVQADEEMHPAKALWNTKSVNAWMKVLKTWPDEATFTTKKRARAKAKQG
ncbi:MAG: hypothetical protein ACI89X_000050 [Planctomycetota bacterium]|jgi:hypothetical protein